MVQETTFLGMPLRTQRQRRLLVVGFNLCVLAFCVLALWRSKGQLPLTLFPQLLVLGGLLGGIKVGGPVKVYEEAMLPLGNGGTQTLNLAGRRPFSEPPFGSPLDERERTQRDHAHYVAYRILRWTLGAASVGYLLRLKWIGTWVSLRAPVLGWMLVVYVLSLPQSVVLWTEPEGPAGELAEVPAAVR